MAEHHASVTWRRGDAAFVDNKYSRAHEWRFDGGATVLGSSSPHNVRVPYSDPAGVDPEEAFVASVASCHMLWFLGIAASKRVLVDSYEDDAVGVLEADAAGKMAITRVVLRPRVVLGGGSRLTDAEVMQIHHEAHEECFVANSVRSEIVIEPRGPAGAG